MRTGIEAGGVKGKVQIVLSNRIYKYFQNQAMDMPNYDESRFIYLGADEGKYIVLPRGLLEEIRKRLEEFLDIGWISSDA